MNVLWHTDTTNNSPHYALNIGYNEEYMEELQISQVS
jgi:hypothetical protein